MKQQTKLGKAKAKISDDTLAEEHRQAIADGVEKVQRMRARTEYDSFDTFLIQFVNERLTDGEPVEICTCDDSTCYFKNGELPPELRHHGTGRFRVQTPKEEMADYLRTHPEATVLQDALQEWREREADLTAEIDKLHGASVLAREIAVGQADPEAWDYEPV